MISRRLTPLFGRAYLAASRAEFCQARNYSAPVTSKASSPADAANKQQNRGQDSPSVFPVKLIRQREHQKSSLDKVFAEDILNVLADKKLTVKDLRVRYYDFFKVDSWYVLFDSEEKRKNLLSTSRFSINGVTLLTRPETPEQTADQLSGWISRHVYKRGCFILLRPVGQPRRVRDALPDAEAEELLEVAEVEQLVKDVKCDFKVQPYKGMGGDTAFLVLCTTPEEAAFAARELNKSRIRDVSLMASVLP